MDSNETALGAADAAGADAATDRIAMLAATAAESTAAASTAAKTAAAAANTARLAVAAIQTVSKPLLAARATAAAHAAAAAVQAAAAASATAVESTAAVRDALAAAATEADGSMASLAETAAHAAADAHTAVLAAVAAAETSGAAGNRPAAVSAALAASSAAAAACTAAATAAKTLSTAATAAVAAAHATQMPACAGSDPPQLPWGGSAWDKLPAELRIMILQRAGHLTRFLCGLLGTKTDVDVPTARAIWRQAIAIDWQGDLGRLPDYRHLASDSGVPCSRRFYYRMMARLPPTATATAACGLDGHRNGYTVDDETPHPCESCHHHIPMQNGWFDLVDFEFPVALGWIAIRFGWTGLLERVAHRHGVRLAKYNRYNRVAVMDVAAQGGHVGVLRVLRRAGSRACTAYAMRAAAENGHLDVVVWLKDECIGSVTDAMACAARGGHLRIVQWVHDRHGWQPTHRQVMDSAASHGHLDVVRWLHENGYECSTRAMDGAAETGQLHMLEWLHANRGEGCTQGAMALATQNGHDKVAAWLRDTFPSLFGAQSSGGA